MYIVIKNVYNYMLRNFKRGEPGKYYHMMIDVGGRRVTGTALFSYSTYNYILHGIMRHSPTATDMCIHPLYKVSCVRNKGESWKQGWVLHNYTL